MKVLFIASGNHKLGISPIVKEQGESLRKTGIDIGYFTIQGKGVVNYIKSIFALKKYLKSNNFDLIHSHFFLSSVVATVINPRKIVVSLMGSDVYTSKIWNLFIKIHHKLKWSATIVKSRRMQEILGFNNLYVIPNGVDLEKFYPVDKQLARNKIGWGNKKCILFGSWAERGPKNYTLAEEAVKILNNDGVELITIKDIPHDLMIFYLNAADVLLMTSKHEGSPNIIKEAMACNCTIVTTDVGDVSWIIGDTAGCYLTSFEAQDIAAKIKTALGYSEKDRKTKGRERIIELGLDSEKVAKIIISVYREVLK